MVKITLYLFLIFVLSGCVSPYPKWANGRVGQPQKSKFKLCSTLFTFENSIDTSAIYIKKTDYKPNPIYTLVRFSNNGIAYWNTFEDLKLLDGDFINQTDLGHFSCYQIKDNIVIIESYSIDLRLYVYLYGRVSENEILFYRKKGRPFWAFNRKIKSVYQKRKVNFNSPLKFPE
jgi:hypothetical protein